MLHHKRREGQSEPLQDVLLTSADGRAWSEVRLSPEVDYRLVDAAADACVTLWGTDWDESSSAVQDFCHGQAAKTVAILGGVTPEIYGRSAPAAGPAGLAVTVSPSVPRTAELSSGESVPYIGPEQEIWVGWSADGAEWEWQAAADIFGLGGGHAEIHLAVGGDFVLAHVEPLRWFIVKAPGV